MNTFLKKTLLFSLPLLVVYLVVTGVVFFTNGRQCQPLEIADDVTTIIVGDSYTECALNDSLLPHTQNLSKSSESYVFTYAKLRYLFAEKPGITTVVMGVSYHNMADYIDDFVYGDKSSDIICRYYPLLKGSDKLALLGKNINLVGDKKLLLTGLKYFYDCKKYGTQSFLGEFLTVPTEKTLDPHEVGERIAMQYYKGENVAGISKTSLQYLDKIVSLCAEHNKKLVFVATPLHQLYIGQIPKKFIEEYTTTIRQYKERVEVVNMKELINLPEQYYLPDGDHVNTEGAILTTQKFKSSLPQLYDTTAGH